MAEVQVVKLLSIGRRGYGSKFDPYLNAARLMDRDEAVEVDLEASTPGSLAAALTGYLQSRGERGLFKGLSRGGKSYIVHVTK